MYVVNVRALHLSSLSFVPTCADNSSSHLIAVCIANLTKHICYCFHKWLLSHFNAEEDVQKNVRILQHDLLIALVIFPLANGWFQKISIPIPQAPFWNSGAGGVLFPKAWGVLSFGILRAGGSKGERKDCECIIKLTTLPMNAESKIQDVSINHTCLRSLTERKLITSGLYIWLQRP